MLAFLSSVSYQGGSPSLQSRLGLQNKPFFIPSTSHCRIFFFMGVLSTNEVLGGHQPAHHHLLISGLFGSIEAVPAEAEAGQTGKTLTRSP